MSIPKMAKAMGYIDDDLVSGAIKYKREKKKNTWVKWGAMAVCLCLVVIGALTIENSLHHKSEDPLSGKFVGNVIEIVDSNQCIVEITAGDHNLPEGATAFVVYEKIVCNSEISSSQITILLQYALVFHIIIYTQLCFNILIATNAESGCCYAAYFLSILLSSHNHRTRM